MKTTIYMGILTIYEIALIIIRRNGLNKLLRDDVTDFIIRIIPIVVCIIGALGD